ncbi:MAG: MarR family winged helix-turn-helix transcriptional regulator, partial [Caldimonas sp.]
MSAPEKPDPRVEAVRRFNRFYTRRIGVLQEGLLDSPFSLTESRLLWEFAHRDRITASELARDLDLDPGYLSRLIRGLKDQHLVRSERAADDARHVHLTLTAAGRRAFAPLDSRSRSDIAASLGSLADSEQQKLLQAMDTIETLLAKKDSTGKAPYLLRSHRPGDIGWVIERHGALYAREYHWDMTFEALVAHIAARFIEHFDPPREACWSAERDHVNVGCVFLVQARDDITDQPLD